MARSLSVVGRFHARLTGLLVPTLDRSDATEAARVFDEMRSDLWRKSLTAWIAVWWRELRSMVTTAVDDRRRRRANRPDASPSGAPSTGSGGWQRGTSRWTWFEQLVADLRYGGRHLLRSPLFTMTSTASVALGIAVVVFVFSAVYAVLWRPLPVAEPDRIVRLAYGNTHPIWSYLDFADATNQAPALTSAAAFATNPVVVRLPEGPPQEMLGDAVSLSFFRVVGVPLAAGRGFSDDDPDDVVIISHRLWQRAFGGSASAVGRRIDVQGRSHVIVGVAPLGFQSLEGPVEPAVWYPIPSEQREQRGWRSLSVVGRLASGATLAQAQAQLDAAAVRLFETNAELHSDSRGEPLPIRAFGEVEGRLPAADRPVVLAAVSGVFGLAALILGLAASNVANLLLGRATQRRPEIAVRLALGASRPRVIRQLLAESLILAAVSGALAMLVVRLGLVVLSNGLVQFVPGPLTLAIDARVLLFATAVAVGAGLLFGLAPALHASRFDLMSTIRRAGTDVSRAGLRRFIVNVQVAGAVVLTATALLFLHSLSRAGDLDSGFDPAGVAVVTVDLNQRQYDPDRAAAFFDEATQRLAATPGVSAIAWARTVPLSGNSTASGDSDIEDYEPVPGERTLIGVNIVTPGYFDLVRIPMRAGREFVQGDRSGAPQALIVNEAFVDRFWPGQNPIGKRVGQRRVVGVAANIRAESLNDVNQPFMWYALAQTPQQLLVAHVRTSGDPAIEGAKLARVVNTLDPYLLVDGGSMEAVTGAATLLQRLLSLVFGAAGLAALALAMMGVYGVMAYLVSLRTREMGVRIALGAAPNLLVRQTVVEGIRMTLLGGGIGLVVSMLIAFAAQATLVGVEPLDPPALLGAVGLITAAAALATLVPARRASRISPTLALRHD